MLNATRAGKNIKQNSWQPSCRHLQKKKKHSQKFSVCKVFLIWIVQDEFYATKSCEVRVLMRHPKSNQ